MMHPQRSEQGPVLSKHSESVGHYSVSFCAFSEHGMTTRGYNILYMRTLRPRDCPAQGYMAESAGAGTGIRVLSPLPGEGHQNLR